MRYAGDLPAALNFVAGAFAVPPDASTRTRCSSRSRARRPRAFLLAPSAAASTPGLLDGYGYNQYLDYDNTSAAVFGQLQWSITDRLRVLPGPALQLRQEDVDFDQQVYGGLQTTNPALIALQLSVLAPQAYTADVDDTNLSGQITVGLQGRGPRQRLRDVSRPASSRSA